MLLKFFDPPWGPPRRPNLAPTPRRAPLDIVTYPQFSDKREIDVQKACMRRKNFGYGGQDCGDDPTLEEIVVMCRAIQATWIASEELSRRTGSPTTSPWQVPIVTAPAASEGKAAE